MSRRPALAVGAGALALALGIGIGLVVDSDDDSSAAAASVPGPVDIGFSQDMVVHHEQAVLMAQLVRPRTKDPKIAALADGILADQLLDIGALRGYLTLWQAPILPAGPPMTWMAADHHEGAAVMPGMATVAELNALRTATGTALDRMFLELMLRHHDGGLTMVDDAAAHAEIAAVRSLAARIAFHQREENRIINALLAAQG